MHLPQQFQDTIYPLTCAFISGSGIAPEEVILGTVTVGGYETFKRVDGKKVLFGDRFLTERYEWPSIEFGIIVRCSMKLEELKRDGQADREAMKQASERWRQDMVPGEIFDAAIRELKRQLERSR